MNFRPGRIPRGSLLLLVGLLWHSLSCATSVPCGMADAQCNEFQYFLLFQYADDSNASYDCFLPGRDDVVAGATLIDINPGAGSSMPTEFICLDKVILFQADDGTNGAELWRTDGTADGTYLLKDINPGGASTPAFLTEYNDLIYFSADDGTNGVELWRTDGTANGTVLFQDINSGAGNGSPANFVLLNGLLVFVATGGTGQELYSTDGSTVTNLTGSLANFSAGIGTLVVAGSLAYADATHTTLNQELWATDGTQAGSFFVADIQAGAGASWPGQLAAYNDTLLFQADDGANGVELWTSDGSTTTLLDINTGAGDSSPQYIIDIGDKAMLRLSPAGSAGLYLNDGTVGGTSAVHATLVPNSTFTEFNGTYYFNGNLAADQEFWETDGTAAGTIKYDLNTGGSSSPNEIVAGDSYVAFRATDGTNGIELWTTPGNTAPTMAVDINPGGDSSPTNIYGADGLFFFRANDGVNGLDLWVYRP